MEIFRLHGFKIVELDRILPEVVDLGEHREGANWRRGTQTQKHWTLFYVVEGTNRLRIEGGAEISMKPGSIACLPPKLRHSGQYGPEPKHRLLWVSFKLTAIDSRNPQWKLSQYLDRPRFAHGLNHLERCFLQVIREATRPSIHQACGLRLALDTLVLEVVRAIQEPRNVLSVLSFHPAISKALGILESRFRKNWTLGELAREVGLSRSRLAELFNVEAGYSIHRFLNRVRIRHAETLLNESDLPIADIATDSGFATLQHFSRVFKEMNGQSPIDFRRDCRPRVG
jgi:AraC-like DNA-binding protein